MQEHSKQENNEAGSKISDRTQYIIGALVSVVLFTVYLVLFEDPLGGMPRPQRGVPGPPAPSVSETLSIEVNPVTKTTEKQ